MELSDDMKVVAPDKEKLNELHYMFIQNVSHELRTPLAIVRGYAELLRDGDLGGLDPDQAQAIMVISNQTQELSKVVERIGILLSMQSWGNLKAQVQLDAVVQEVLEDLQHAVAENNLHLECTIEPDLSTILGDPYHLQHAVASLLENAIKFTPHGGHVQVRLYSQDDCIGCEVKDTGIGITEEHLEHLFDGFYQADPSPTRRYGGLGLGLTLVKAIVDAHGGRMDVHSVPEQGSTFTVYFPCLQADTEVEVMSDDIVRKKSILVVDDEERVALTMQVGLEKLPDFEVSVATNGKQALNMLAQRHFDLVITDYRMPGMDGMTLVEQVRQQFPWLAIVMLTAYNSEALRRHAERYAVQQVLNKPVKLAEIRRVAAAALQRPESS